MKTRKPKSQEMTLADHAEAWHRKNRRRVPRRGTARWWTMCEAWHTWAFQDFKE